MSNFTDALTSAARSAACTVLGSADYINDTLQRLGAFPFDEARRAIPNLWRNALCDRDAPPPNPPSFTGGQCPDIRYNVNVLRRVRRQSNGEILESRIIEGAFFGPINQFIESLPNDVRRLVITHAGGNENSLSQSTNGFDILFLGIESITTVGGVPDVCGNPDPSYDPVEPPDVTIPRDVPYENSDGVQVTIPVVFVFARAQLDVNANITIPFTLNITPTLNITGTVNVDGTVNFNFGGGNATSLPKDPRKGDCGDIAIPEEEPPDDPTDSDQPPEPEREREEVIKGVLVTVTSLSNERASLIVQEDNPDIYAPSLGFVQFLCRIGQTSAAWTSDQPVKNRRNLIQCPWDDGAIAVRGTPQPGVTWTLTPVYGYAGQPVEYVQ